MLSRHERHHQSQPSVADSGRFCRLFCIECPLTTVASVYIPGGGDGGRAGIRRTFLAVRPLVARRWTRRAEPGRRLNTDGRAEYKIADELGGLWRPRAPDSTTLVPMILSRFTVAFATKSSLHWNFHRRRASSPPKISMFNYWHKGEDFFVYADYENGDFSV